MRSKSERWSTSEPPQRLTIFLTAQELRCPRPAAPSELRFVEKHPPRFKHSLLDAAEPDLEVLSPLSSIHLFLFIGGWSDV